MKKKYKEHWTIELSGKKVHFTRYINNKVNEAYAPVSKRKAAVCAAAIIQGFEPPRLLRDSDIPAG